MPPANGTGATRSPVYDSCDRLVRQTDPLGRETRTFYDGNGSVVRTELPSDQSIVTDHDVLDRPRRTTYRRANGSVENSVVTTYDGFGNPISTSDSEAEINREFDLRDRVVAVRQVHLGVTTRLRYDLAGNRTRVSVDRLPGTTLAYTWDAMNRLQSIEAGEGKRGVSGETAQSGDGYAATLSGGRDRSGNVQATAAQTGVVDTAPPHAVDLTFSRSPAHLSSAPLSLTVTFDEPLGSTPTPAFSSPGGDFTPSSPSGLRVSDAVFVFATNVAGPSSPRGDGFRATVPATSVVDLAGNAQVAPDTFVAAVVDTSVSSEPVITDPADLPGPLVWIESPAPGSLHVEGEPILFSGGGPTASTGTCRCRLTR